MYDLEAEPERILEQNLGLVGDDGVALVHEGLLDSAVINALLRGRLFPLVVWVDDFGHGM